MIQFCTKLHKTMLQTNKLVQNLSKLLSLRTNQPDLVPLLIILLSHYQTDYPIHLRFLAASHFIHVRMKSRHSWCPFRKQCYTIIRASCCTKLPKPALNQCRSCPYYARCIVHLGTLVHGSARFRKVVQDSTSSASGAR